MAFSLKKILTQILTKGVSKNNGAATEPIMLSYKNTGGQRYRAIGFYSNLDDEILGSSAAEMLQFISTSSGAIGTMYIGPDTGYARNMLPATNYYYIYMPHRHGGTNGAVYPSGNDNCKYGSLYL